MPYACSKEAIEIKEAHIGLEFLYFKRKFMNQYYPLIGGIEIGIR